jgi:aspartate racemase
MKTMGVLGGVGPQATMDFEARVHAVSQRLLPANANRGYPPMVVYYHRGDLMEMQDDGSLVSPVRADPGLLDAARRLGAWADFLVMPCNGAHRCRAEIEEAAGRPVLSMVDMTVEEACRRPSRSVGLITYGAPVVYRPWLEERGVRCESLPEDLQARLNLAIMSLQAGGAGPAESATAREAVATLRARGVDSVVLGCTEVPLLLGAEADAPDLINPAAILADAAVRYAIA